MITQSPRVRREQLLLGLAVMVGGLAAAGRSQQEIIGYVAPQLARCGLLTPRDVRDVAAAVSRLAPSMDEATETLAAGSYVDGMRRVARAEVQLAAMRSATAALETLADALA